MIVTEPISDAGSYMHAAQMIHDLGPLSSLMFTPLIKLASLNALP